jgi:desumoylating isopeptidase 1
MKSYIGERLPTKTSTNTAGNIPDLVKTTTELSALIPLTSIFPLIDLWRLALLIPEVTSHMCSSSSAPIPKLLRVAADAASGTENKNLHITALKLACNIFANPALVRLVLSRSQGTEPRDALTQLLVNNLLSELENVREAAASLAFNIATFLQKPLMDTFERGMTGQMPKDEIVNDWDWRIELLSAVIEAIGREKSEGTRKCTVFALFLVLV